MSTLFIAPDLPTDDDEGFPPNTPLDEMTDAEQAAYWRDQAKTQQRKLREAVGQIRRTLNAVAPH